MAQANQGDTQTQPRRSKRRYRDYTPQDRINAYALLQEGASVRKAALAVGAPPTTVHEWIQADKAASDADGYGNRTASDDPLDLWRRLERRALSGALDKVDTATFRDLTVGAGIARDKLAQADRNAAQSDALGDMAGALQSLAAVLGAALRPRDALPSAQDHGENLNSGPDIEATLLPADATADEEDPTAVD